MKFAFRADASTEAGSGHVMRCLTLADELNRQKAEVFFICRDHPANLIAFIGDEKKYPVRVLPRNASWRPPSHAQIAHAHWLREDPATDALQTVEAIASTGGADVLVVDHYALDAGWETAVKSACRKIAVIDDLADRRHECDILLDQNFYHDPPRRYRGLIPERCRLLCGPRFALVRAELAAKAQPRPVPERIKRVMVFFGMGDPSGLTPRTLRILKPLAEEFGFSADAVPGLMSPHVAEVKSLCASLPGAVCHDRFADMAEIFAGADLFIGAGGTVTWERCLFGVPSVIVGAAAHQNPYNRDMAEKGAHLYLGMADKLADADIAAAVRTLAGNPPLRRLMGEISRGITDGKGTGRVARLLLLE